MFWKLLDMNTALGMYGASRVPIGEDTLMSDAFYARQRPLEYHICLFVWAPAVGNKCSVQS